MWNNFSNSTKRNVTHRETSNAALELHLKNL